MTTTECPRSYNARVAAALKYADQLDAHMDAGGTTGPNNVRDLIEMIRSLHRPAPLPGERASDDCIEAAMTKDELNSRRQRSAIMDAAANCWDPVEGKRIANQLREACNGHPHAKIPWPHRILHEAAAALEARAAE